MAAGAPSLSAVPNAVPFAAGADPRRWNRGSLSKAEGEFRALLESEHIPKASKLLGDIFTAATAGDIKAAELFFKVCGLIKKPTDAAVIQEQARALLDAMMTEARARRTQGDGG